MHPFEISAKDALAQTHKQWDSDPLYSGLFLKIKSTINQESGDTSCNYYTGGEHLSDAQIQRIEDLGYSITWNSPCLWYEISWD